MDLLDPLREESHERALRVWDGVYMSECHRRYVVAAVSHPYGISPEKIGLLTHPGDLSEAVRFEHHAKRELWRSERQAYLAEMGGPVENWVDDFGAYLDLLADRDAGGIPDWVFDYRAYLETKERFAHFGSEEEPPAFAQGFLAFVAPEHDKLVHVRVETRHAALKPGWFSWSAPRMRASVGKGGGALDAKDGVQPEGHFQLLLPKGQVRYLELRIRASTLDGVFEGEFPFDVLVELDGDPDTHRIPCHLRVKHPGSKLLATLPQIYAQELDAHQRAMGEEGRASFFERYLIGFEDVLQPLQQTLDRLHQIFGAHSCPSPYLLWLSAWVCAPVDHRWPEMKQRALVAQAVRLHGIRGTKEGLSEMLRIFTGNVPEIEDQPVEGMRLGKGAVLGQTTQLGDIKPHMFVVTLIVSNAKELNEDLVRAILDQEKPAHTTYKLRILRRNP